MDAKTAEGIVSMLKHIADQLAEIKLALQAMAGKMENKTAKK